MIGTITEPVIDEGFQIVIINNIVFVLMQISRQVSSCSPTSIQQTLQSPQSQQYIMARPARSRQAIHIAHLLNMQHRVDRWYRLQCIARHSFFRHRCQSCSSLNHNLHYFGRTLRMEKILNRRIILPVFFHISISILILLSFSRKNTSHFNWQPRF